MPGRPHWITAPHAWLLNWRGDVFGGITAGVIALPLALAFGVASGLGAAAGMYGAIAVGLLAAAFGGTPSQVSGPTGPMTIVVAGLVASFSGNPAVVFGAIALGGVFQVLFGVLKLGAFIRYVPYPVVSGFMSGIGIIIIVLQALPLLGHSGSYHVIDNLLKLPVALSHANLAALSLGLAGIALVYLTGRITQRIPGALVALITLTPLAWALKLEVPKIGAIPLELPTLHIPPLNAETLVLMVIPGLMLAALGSIDSLLTSLIADTMTRSRHDSDRELIGQGLGNIFAGLIGGIPGAGATKGTVVSVMAGGKTPLAGIVHSLFLLVVMLGLSKVAAEIPLAVLAGILISVGMGIIDVRGLRHFLRIPRADAAVNFTVLLLTVFVDLIKAVAAGMIMASLIFVKRMSDLDFAPPTLANTDEDPAREDHPQKLLQNIYVVPVNGPLFFGNALRLQTVVMALADAGGVVLDFAHSSFIDQSAAYTLSDLALDLQGKGIPVALCGLQEQPRRILRLMGIAPGEIDQSRLHPDTESSVQAILKHMT
ncbi:MAG: SulP family inorganic anion transporter [Candidatus Sericytochromatia bacterium]|nr:SulP family inorganic anion transporter [Candidatus Sericytochromatia bacterium]